MGLLTSAAEMAAERTKSKMATQNWELTPIGKQKAENAMFSGDIALVVSVLQEKSVATTNEIVRESGLDPSKVKAVMGMLKNQRPPIIAPARGA